MFAAAVLAAALAHAAAAHSQTTADTPEGAGAQASRDTEETVKELMRRGLAEYQKGRLEAAREAFAEAWRLKPYTDLAATLADVEMRLGRHRDAAEHWDYYIKDSPHDRADAEAKLAECRRHVATVHVVTNVPDATILVNRKTVNFTPGRPLFLEPGTHTLSAERKTVALFARRSRRQAEATVQVTAGSDYTVELKFQLPSDAVEATPARVAIPPVTPSAPAVARKHDESKSGRNARTIAVVTGVGLTAAAAAVTTVFALKGAAAEDDADEIRGSLFSMASGQHPCGTGTPYESECNKLNEALEERNRNNRIANGAMVVAGVSAVGTLAAYFLWPVQGDATSKATGLQLAPWSTATAAGLQMDLGF